MSESPAIVIDPSAQIARTAIVGRPFRPLVDGRRLVADRPTVVAENVWIGDYSTVGQGAKIGAAAILEDFVGVEVGCDIGPRALLTSRSWIGLGVTVGEESVVTGYVGDNCRIGAGCKVAGDLIHRQLDPSLAWDDPAADEPAPVVMDGAFVGWRAMVIGGVNIGERAYVCAGAVVTRDVPAGCISFGHNQVIRPPEWPGALGKSAFFDVPGHERPAPPGERVVRQAVGPAPPPQQGLKAHGPIASEVRLLAAICGTWWFLGGSSATRGRHAR